MKHATFSENQYIYYQILSNLLLFISFAETTRISWKEHQYHNIFNKSQMKVTNALKHYKEGHQCEWYEQNVANMNFES